MSINKKIAVYPGTFDPVTNGHIDIVKRSLKIFDLVIVAIAANPTKKPLFDFKERVIMVEDSLKVIGNVNVQEFEGLLVEYSHSKGAIAIIRGLRAVSDFEFEFQMALMNRKLDPSIETIYLMPSEEHSYLSSTIIKNVASYGGNVGSLVPPLVEKNLRRVFNKP